VERVKCWWCGVEPIDFVEITSFGDREPRYLPNWPGADHEHAETPPSPAQLEDPGHRALMRLRSQALD
jgi:hypothetical protein